MGWLILLILAVIVAALGPCPTPVPPPGPIGEISQAWGTVLFFACALYAWIDRPEFRFWAKWLPVVFVAIFLPFALLNGGMDHAIYLLIALFASMVYGMIFSFVKVVIIAERGTGFVTMAILFVYSLAISTLALANAQGFAADLC